MRILIAYATTEGHTETIAQFVEKRFVSNGIDVTLAQLKPGDVAPDPADYALVVLTGSIHAGRYQKALIEFCRTHHNTLNSQSSVFLSVSLTAISNEPNDKRLLETQNATFFEETGWHPTVATHLIAGALKFSAYDFLKDWAMRYIAWRKGLPTDPSQDHVFTDWAALGAIIDDLARIYARAA